MRLPLVLRPLQHRDFALLWTGQTISTIGNAVHMVALPWQVLLLTGSAVQLGITTAIFLGSGVVFLLVGGVIVDRVPRRRVILVSDLTSGIVVSVVAVLSATGLLRVEHLYVSSAIFGASFSFFFPAMSAILPELVPADVLVQGNVVRGFQRQLGRLVGPILGGALVGAFGPAVAFAFDAATFFVSFVALLAMRPTASVGVARRGIVTEIAEGVRFTFSLTWLWFTIFGFAFVNAAFQAPWIVGMPVLVREVLHADATTFGLIASAFALGEVVGGIALGQFRVRRIGIAMYLYTVVSGIGLAAIGAAPTLPAILVMSAVIGVAFVGFGVLWETALQRYVPRELLGRVSSVDMFGAILLGPVAPIVGGVLVERFGAPPIFVWGGIGIVAFGLGGLLLASIRRLE